MNGLKKGWVWLLLAIILLAGGAAALKWWKKADTPQYRTAKLEKGTLTASVAASGTLAPVVSVQVGSQVSGQLKEVLVDFNSLVKKGQLIARIDPETFEYKVRQAQADVDAARAQVLTQQATIAAQRAAVSQVQVSLADARLDLERKEQLRAKNLGFESAIACKDGEHFAVANIAHIGNKAFGLFCVHRASLAFRNCRNHRITIAKVVL